MPNNVNDDLKEFDDFENSEVSLADLSKAIDLIFKSKNIETLKGELSHDQPSVAHQDMMNIIKKLLYVDIATQIKATDTKLKGTSLDKLIECINMAVDPNHAGNSVDCEDMIGKAIGSNYKKEIETLQALMEISSIAADSPDDGDPGSTPSSKYGDDNII